MQQQAQFVETHSVLTQLPSFRLYDRVRRVADVLISFCSLVLTAPLLAIIAAAIKMDSVGPVLFVQERVGRNRRRRQQGPELYDNVVRLDLRRADSFGRPFKMIKFRTMREDAEATTGPVWAQENDPRVTRVGRFLRRTRFDELPQLWNVLRGDMTLIGPRPERPAFVRQFVQQVEGYYDRHWVTPGITGLAQVRQGYDRCVEDVRRKVQFDLEYIRSRSPWIDFLICWQTVVVMLVGRGSR